MRQRQPLAAYAARRQPVPRDRAAGASSTPVGAAPSRGDAGAPRRHRRRLRAAAAAVLAALAGVGAAAAAPAPAAAPPADPWRLLVAVRESLVASGPVVADFVQTYTPAGFTSGERESGKVSLALPTCLRWDYELPFPKSYLLCGRSVYSWNPGEGSGRKQLVDRDKEPGLDLLFLSVEELRRRYRASAKRLPTGATEIALAPLEARGPAVRATLVVDPTGAHLDGLSHQDPDGSVTRFNLSGWRSLTDERAFAPPKIEWIEE
jgi:hypothetical protein